MANLFPPFDPEETPRRRVRQLRQIPFRLILPNLVTLLAMCAGLTAIRMAIEGRLEFAVSAILLAALLDGIDGRIARLLRSTTRFGAELDSLTDFVNFGVAPAILLYVWTLTELRSVGWIAALVFAICGALRLARFNVALDATDKPDWHADFFVGVPAPAAAGIVLLPLYLEFLGLPHGFFTAPLVLVYTLAIAFLMISKLPTWSGKRFGRRVSRDAVLPIFVLVVLFVALLASFPWQVLSACVAAYLASLPFAWDAWSRNAAEERAKTAAPEGEKPPA